MTDFNKIYKLFLDTEINSQLVAEMDGYSLTDLLNSILFMARSELYKSIYDNETNTLNIMEDITEFETFNYEFKYDNTSPLFILSPIPSNEHNIQVSLNDVELDYGIQYTYDMMTGEINILKDMSLGDVISVIAYRSPIFNQTLNIMEIGLLVMWMGVVFLRDKLKDQKVNNFTVHGKEDKVYAQAPFMNALKDSLKEAELLARQKTIEYTYKLAPDKLKGHAVKGLPYIMGGWKR